MKLSLILLVAIGIFGLTFSNAYAENVPSWIKNTAGWWATDQISETEFVSAIEFLINDGIIRVSFDSSSDSSQGIPPWIKNTAGWWATDQISETEFISAIEFLIKIKIINPSGSYCEPTEDKNGDGTPDEISNLDLTAQTSFTDKNWANCKFVGDLSELLFKNVDLTNADFSNTVLTNSVFRESTLTNTNFSDAKLHGSLFYQSELIDVNFSNADFSPDAWENPFYIYTISDDGVNSSCYLSGVCMSHKFGIPSFNDLFYSMHFGESQFPTNLKHVDTIDDQSEFRTLWKHVASFVLTEIENPIFDNSDLSDVFIINSKMSNADLSNSDTSRLEMFNTNLKNVRTENDYFDSRTYPNLILPERNLTSIPEISIKKYLKTYDNDFDIKFKGTLGNVPINWSMGMTIYDEKLYVADTDNHRIIIYDTQSLEKLTSFSSPIQNFCNGANAFTVPTENCPNELRNLPTSLAVTDSNIFVSYGFQDEIQVFDLNGNFLSRFGNSGNSKGEFNTPHNISISKNKLYVADSLNYRIQVFDLNGEFLSDFSTIIDNSSKSKPSDIAIFDDELFILNTNYDSISVFDLNGNFSRSVELNLNTQSSFSSLYVENEMMFLTDPDNHKIIILDLSGEPILEFGIHGNFYGEFNGPRDIIYDGKRIFISDAYNYRVQIFDLDFE